MLENPTCLLLGHCKDCVIGLGVGGLGLEIRSHFGRLLEK